MINRLATAILAVLLAASPAAAEKTRVRLQTKASDFEKGSAEKVSIRSDGSIELAPRLREVFSTPSEYLWDLARDASGAVYAAGGPDAKVHRIAPDGESSVFFETEAVEAHALAFGADGNLYVATAPDSKVFRVTPDGESSVFYETDSVYVWDMVFDAKGDLYLATGDKGEIHRVSPDGTGEVFFRTEETHVRSLAIDPNGDLIVGADPGGLVIRISKGADGAARGFVLYQSPKKEITSVVVDPDGAVYAAGVGTRTAAPPTQRRTPAPRPTPPPASPAGQPAGRPASPAAGAPVMLRPAAARTAPIQGGSAIVRIAPDGEPRQVWASPRQIVYALGLDGEQRLLIGTGDGGRLIRLESEAVSTLLLTSASSQITAITPGDKGAVLMATSNIGAIFELGPGLETEGIFESEVLDAKNFSRFGRLESETEGAVAVSMRSGNLLRPVRNWSEWSATAPAARFVQWRAELRSSEGDGTPPRLDSVRLFYRPKNLAPRVGEMEVTPPNYRFAPRRTTPTSRNLTLSPLGGSVKRASAGPTGGQQTMAPNTGSQGVRWKASDPNQDKLRAKVEIRGEGERQWTLLEEDLGIAFFDFDSTAFADGRYRLRITVSDQADNPAGDGLKHNRESEPFLIDNSAPRIDNLSAALEQGRLRVRFGAADTTSKIARAEISINGEDWFAVSPASDIFDSTELSFDFSSEEVEGEQHVVAVRVEDEHKNRATAKAVVEP